MRKKGTAILAMSEVNFPIIGEKGTCKLTTSIAAINRIASIELYLMVVFFYKIIISFAVGFPCKLINIIVYIITYSLLSVT